MKLMTARTQITATFTALALLSAAGLACSSKSDESPAAEEPGAGGSTTTAPECTADDSCNPDCAAGVDPDCTSDPGDVPWADVVPPNEMMDCSNVVALEHLPLGTDPGEYVLGTEGAECIVYELAGDLDVNSDQTLTIEAGVTLRFQKDKNLFVQRGGVLNVNGTQEVPVLFTGSEQTRGHWKGIQFENTINQQDERGISHIQYAIVEYGGAGLPGDYDGNISLYRSGLCLEHSLLRESGSNGLELGTQAHLSCFDSNIITASDDYAARVATHAVGSLNGHNRFDGNDSDYVNLLCFSDELILTPTTLSYLNVPYRLEGECLSWAMLTIEAGAHFVAAEGADFTTSSTDGGLIAKGTPERPIVFEGEQHTPGYWRGVRIENSDQDNVLEYVIFRDGGKNEVVARANLTFRSDLQNVRPTGVVNNCVFENSSQWCVEVQNATAPEGLLENNSFEGCASGELNEFNN